jgi:3D (Asp-Asp-Asp) domain-containing protein/predicted  nucleic acid-binding Zn-ribbon protein
VVLLGLLLAAPAALADDPGSLRSEAERLRAENTSLAAQSQQALLQLYALETRLAQAETRLAGLRARTAELERETEAARDRLRVARSDLDLAEQRLASRLQTLYIEGEVDPLAVLLGATSLSDALRALEDLDTLAADDDAIVSQVRAARAQLKRLLIRLAERRAELEALLGEAEATRASLAAARSERAAYVARLRTQQAFNASLIVSLLDRASAAEARAAQIAPEPAAEPVAVETESAPDASPAPASASEPAPAPAPVSAPAQGGRLTVSSTGYCLRGTTATGMPVGWGVVAVDPSVIPLGTRMTVPGYGEGVAADTGSAVVGNTIDLWFPSCAQARGWGRRTVTITLH